MQNGSAANSIFAELRHGLLVMAHGDRIRELGRVRELTMKKFAALVGTSDQQISHPGRGRRKKPAGT